MTNERDPATFGGVTFHHVGAFWVGVLCVTFGVILHLPMYLSAAGVGYRLAGMPMDMGMCIGMLAIVIGLVASLYGLWPPGSVTGSRICSTLELRGLDEVQIGGAHLLLLAAMAVAVTIDVMKPTSLAFVMPGMTQEYGLKSPLNPGGTVPAALLPLAGITGTVLGSVLWGWLGDKIGRRASILYAGINFVATSICGTMPDFSWNLVMCFLMGLGVGGMLPIAYTLLAETMPTRHRGWLMVLVGADIAGAYVLTSWLAAALVPAYSWRILWLIGLPTGILFIALNRWIPESPRFLLGRGRVEEAEAVMRKYGVMLVDRPVVAQGRPTTPHRWRELAEGTMWRPTLVLVCIAIAAGFVLFGFNLWIPTNLRKLGVADSDAILRNSAIIGLPLTVAVAVSYGFWSSRNTIAVLAGATGISLGVFALNAESVAGNRALLYVCLVFPITGINCLIAVLSVYGAEVFPTMIRSRGSGLCAAATKAGGVFIIGLVVLGIAPPTIAAIAAAGAGALAVALVGIVAWGRETRRRSLEDIDQGAQRAAVL